MKQIYHTQEIGNSRKIYNKKDNMLKSFSLEKEMKLEKFMEHAPRWFIHDNLTWERNTYLKFMLQKLIEMTQRMADKCMLVKEHMKTNIDSTQYEIKREPLQICLAIEELGKDMPQRGGIDGYTSLLKMCISLNELMDLYGPQVNNGVSREMDKCHTMKQVTHSFFHTAMHHLERLITMIMVLLEQNINYVYVASSEIAYKSMKHTIGYTFSDMFGEHGKLLNEAGSTVYSDWCDNSERAFCVKMALIILIQYLQNRAGMPDNEVMTQAQEKNDCNLKRTIFATTGARVQNGILSDKKLKKIMKLHDLIAQFAHTLRSYGDCWTDEENGCEFEDYLIHYIVGPELLLIHNLPECYAALVEIQGPALLEERELKPITNVKSFYEECKKYLIECDNLKARDNLDKKYLNKYDQEEKCHKTEEEEEWNELAKLPQFPPRILDVLERLASIAGLGSRDDEEPVCAYCHNFEEHGFYLKMFDQHNEHPFMNDKPFYIMYQHCSCKAISCRGCFAYNYTPFAVDNEECPGDVEDPSTLYDLS